MNAIVGFTRAYEESSERLGFCALAAFEGGGCTPGPGSDVTGAPGQADFECEHGRLAGDTCPSPVVKYLDGTTVQSWPEDHPCGCWPSEQITVERMPVRELLAAPNLMSTLKRAEEAVMETTEAPFGYKADGTPRKRPAPPSASLEKARAAKAAKALAAPPATAVAPEPEPDPDPPANATVTPANENPILGAVRAIQAMRDALLDQIEGIDERMAELAVYGSELHDLRAEIHARFGKLGGAQRTLDDLLEHDVPIAA